MKFLFLIVGLVLIVGAMANTSLLYIGVGILLLSAIFSNNSEKSISKIADKKEGLFEKLDKLNVVVPDKAINNMVEDMMFVTASIAKGKKPTVNAKRILDATVDSVQGNVIFDRDKE